MIGGGETYLPVRQSAALTGPAPLEPAWRLTSCMEMTQTALE